MAVEYREMRAEDEHAVFDLRMRTWDAPSIEYVRAGALLDPRYLEHTFVAFDFDGTLLSTVRYWLRHIRDAKGTPRLVGCVASVVTIEKARRQGHARKLMQLAIDAMREDGCDWTLLLSSRMAPPLYEGLGYRLYQVPYYTGIVSGERPPGEVGYSVRRLDPPFNIDDDTWKSVREIYSAYNAHRPLSLVRDDDYWHGYFLRSLLAPHASHQKALFVARDQEGQDVGYLLAYIWSQETARELHNLDRAFTIGEIGVLPDHDTALSALLSSATGVLTGRVEGQIGMTAILPRERRIEDGMCTILGKGMRILTGAG
jgi:GNAT superfamily N-acetyltransferase